MKGKHIVSAFSYPSELSMMIDEAKKIAVREEKTLSKLIQELLEKYVKEHGSGNPSYSLDKFADPDFHITPAFGESFEKWKEFIEKEKDLDKIEAKAEVIRGLVNKKHRYGTTNVIIY